MINPVLTIENFSKHYGHQAVIAISKISLPGGLYWIKGENGSGKTTLFKSLAGLLPCTGNIQFEDGVSLHDHPVAYRKRVNYSEAEPLYPGFLTAKDLLRFTGKARDASLQQQQELVSAFGMESYADSPCETYSSGMQKKLSLVLALLGSPRLVILDEPLITLDVQARNILLDRVEGLLQQKAIVLMSSHQLLEDDRLRVDGMYAIQNKTLVPA
jgi:ABC-2 type transport system ATP-binding protein